LGIISWLIFGALAGWVASLIFGNNGRQGWIGNIVVGIVGAMIGGFIGNALFGDGVSGFNVGSFFIAVVGALILLFGMKAVAGKNAQPAKQSTNHCCDQAAKVYRPVHDN
jgi:uncharacterized membrane protein YeaQ/YmgE (transglycosylase-associated protein family)